ncbi:MAG: hypothetical protein QOK27_1736 [Gemmatimonadales bacterium]|nr:hypothetical protein [Gemmatimonadales bacterium]
MMDDSADDPVPLHLAKLLDQHLLRDRRDRLLQLRKPQQSSAEQMEENHQLPAAFQNFERLFDAPRGRGGRVLAGLTLG